MGNIDLKKALYLKLLLHNEFFNESVNEEIKNELHKELNIILFNNDYISVPNPGKDYICIVNVDDNDTQYLLLRNKIYTAVCRILNNHKNEILFMIDKMDNKDKDEIRNIFKDILLGNNVAQLVQIYIYLIPLENKVTVRIVF